MWLNFLKPKGWLPPHIPWHTATHTHIHRITYISSRESAPSNFARFACSTITPDTSRICARRSACKYIISYTISRNLATQWRIIFPADPTWLLRWLSFAMRRTSVVLKILANSVFFKVTKFDLQIGANNDAEPWMTRGEWCTSAMGSAMLQTSPATTHKLLRVMV